MAIYVTKGCPNCGFVYQHHKGGDQRKYGCPLIICPRCRNQFWDDDIKEPALYGYHNFHETKESISNIVIGIVYGLMNLFFLGLSIYELITDFKHYWGCLILLAFSVLMLWIIFSYIYRTYFDKNAIKSKIREQQQQYDESLIRMKDIDYVTALSKRDKLAKKYLNVIQSDSSVVWQFAPRPAFNETDSVTLNNSEKQTQSAMENHQVHLINASHKILYCRKCGNRLLDGSIYCNKCGERVLFHNICPQCGNELAEGSIFCNKCGTKVK